MDMSNMYPNMSLWTPTDQLPFAPAFPYGIPPYTSPVTSYPYSYTDTSFAKSDTDTSPSTSNDNNESNRKHRSPEEQAKYRYKREKNNEAAKQSRKKRTDREKNLSQQLKIQEDINQKQQLDIVNYQSLLQQSQAEINRLRMELQRCQQQQPSVEILGDKTNSIADSKPYDYAQYPPYL